MAKPAPILTEWHERGVLRLVDVHFASMLASTEGPHDDLALLGAALASRAPAFGHLCLDLERLDPSIRLERSPDDSAPSVRLPSAADFKEALNAHPAVSSGQAGNRPLVLDGHRLYLTRYWECQRSLAQDILRRATGRLAGPFPSIKRTLPMHFPECYGPGTSGGTDQLDLLQPLEFKPTQQLVAALTALNHTLTVVCGGPGTGKTTTVVRMLSMILEAWTGEAPAEILCLAPTGKAASRLAESVAAACDADTFFAPGVRQQMPTEASTIHRALGLRHGSQPNADRTAPLTADVVVVDEASMVDLVTMSQVFAAIKPSARLILLGDPHQLMSVEAGTVLAELIASKDARSEEQSRTLGDLCGVPASCFPVAGTAGALGDCVVELKASHRFKSESGIGTLSAHIHHGRSQEAADLLLQGAYTDVTFVDASNHAQAHRAIQDVSSRGYAGLLACSTPEEALAAAHRFRILTPHRRGKLGVTRLNELMEETLGLQGEIAEPILITENDPLMKLYNGDTGVRSTSGDETIVSFRAGTEGGLRSLHPARLPRHEPVFAMTVHKSQGSEFEEVLLVLPERPSPILTRELLYTAVTRARTQLTIVGSLTVFQAAIAERIERASGLAAALAKANEVTTQPDKS